MKAMPAAPCVLGVDTLATLSREQILWLIDNNFEFRAGYLDHLTPEEIEIQVEQCDLPLMLYTYANEFDSGHALFRCQTLSIPKGATVILDCESEGGYNAVELISKIRVWAKAIKSGGFIAGLYVGAGCPLTSEELYAELPEITRYVQGCSRLLDRYARAQVPHRGYSMIQLRPPNTLLDGVLFDVAVTQQDYEGSHLTWIVAD